MDSTRSSGGNCDRGGPSIVWHRSRGRQIDAASVEINFRRASSARSRPSRLHVVARLASLAMIPAAALVANTWLLADDWTTADIRVAAQEAQEPVSTEPARQSLAGDAAILDRLQHPEATERRRALEDLESQSNLPTPVIQKLVEKLARQDADPLVQGRAQLLLLDWSLARGAAAVLSAPTAPPVTRPADEPSPVRLRVPASPQTPLAIVPPARDLEFAPEEPVVGEPQTTDAFPWDTEPTLGRARLASLELSEDELPPPAAPAMELDTPPGQPDVLYRPLEQPFAEPTETELLPDFGTMVQFLRDAPAGYAGLSSVAPTEYQTSGHFVPIEDRWRIGLPYWDRYGKGHPPGDDYPFVEGHWWDPYNQNVLKGDYPIIGQHTFLNLTAATSMLQELRSVPTATTPFESTHEPYQAEFFGNPQQYFYNQNFKMAFDLFHGNAAFKPVDWRVKVTPTFNLNYLDANELGVVGPDVRSGTTRARQFFALEEWFVERKLADLSPDYDFMSLRVGSQPFSSDFRGFIFNDINRGARLFGTLNANRDQFNLAVFDQLEKDTNSQLNSFHDREQTVAIANYYRQDFIFPGYTAEASFHYNNDGPSFHFDENDFLARPDPTGSYREHRVEAYYMGFAGEGHMGRFNVSNAFYWALGRDSFNPLAGREQSINAQMAALELSYDRDWARFRTSFFWASGDDNIMDREARGFDSIVDNPNFVGGGFSYWQRQNVRLFGVGLTQRESLLPDLRSSKTQGQSNFVNPGIFIYNLGLDADITPKVRLINNVNFLWFHKTEILERYVFQDDIQHDIGVDLSTGTEYRPFLNDNVIIVMGAAVFLPGSGIKDLYGKTEPFTTENAMNFDASALFQAFMDVVLTF